MMDCTHDGVDKDIAVDADGFCPICQQDEIIRLRADNKKLREALEELMRAETNQQFAAAGQKARAVIGMEE